MIRKKTAKVIKNLTTKPKQTKDYIMDFKRFSKNITETLHLNFFEQH